MIAVVILIYVYVLFVLNLFLDSLIHQIQVEMRVKYGVKNKIPFTCYIRRTNSPLRESILKISPEVVINNNITTNEDASSIKI